MGSDLGMRFAIWSLDLAFCNFAFFKHSFKCKHRSLKRGSYFLIFVIRESNFLMSVNRDPLFFRFVNRARDPPVRPSFKTLSVRPARSKLTTFRVTAQCSTNRATSIINAAHSVHYVTT